mgnify:FL=1
MKKILVLFFCFCFFNVNAQESELGNWLIYIGNKKVNEKWSIHNEIQYRNYEFAGDLEQLLLRTGVGYNLTNNSNLLLGYGFIKSENYINTTDKETVNEHRIFQQLTTKQNIGIFKISHRYRFEQRFVESNFKMRLRYFLSMQIPLTKRTDKGMYLSAYNEIFINTTNKLFDRNRIYSGMGYRINKNIRIEAGYMNQLFLNGSRDQLNFISFINF